MVIVCLIGLLLIVDNPIEFDDDLSEVEYNEESEDSMDLDVCFGLVLLMFRVSLIILMI